MSSFRLRLLSAISAAAAVTCLSSMAQAQGNSQNAPGQNKSEVIPASNHDHNFVLRGTPGKPIDTSVIKEAKDKRRVPYDDAPDFIDDFAAQTAPITATSSAALTTAGLGLDGVGKGFPGFTVQSAPPDTTGAVGATQFVQWVNTSFAVFDKATGAAVYGPVPGNTLFTGFGGPCEATNDGDPVVQYDKLANRWVLMQFAVPTGGPYLDRKSVV